MAQNAPHTTNNSAKPTIIVASFGTSVNETRAKSIGAIESSIREHFPEYDVRRAFTSKTIIKKLAERDGIKIDSLEEALEKLVSEGKSSVVIQPTHFIVGMEFEKIQALADSFKDRFEHIVVSQPLLVKYEDYIEAVKAISERMRGYDDGETAICLMGHGNDKASNESYSILQTMFIKRGLMRYFVGTVEGEPGIDQMIALTRRNGLSKVVLHPFMLCGGDHARKDMADTDNPESWASKFLQAGIGVSYIIEGCGELYGFHKVYITHLQEAINSLNA